MALSEAQKQHQLAAKKLADAQAEHKILEVQNRKQITILEERYLEYNEALVKQRAEDARVGAGLLRWVRLVSIRFRVPAAVLWPNRSMLVSRFDLLCPLCPAAGQGGSCPRCSA